MKTLKFQFTIRQMLEIITWISIAITLLTWAAVNSQPMPLGPRRSGWLNRTEIFGFLIIYFAGVASLGAAVGVLFHKRLLLATAAGVLWFGAHFIFFS